MKTIYIIKMISIILIFSMIFSVVPNVSFASNNKTEVINVVDKIWTLIKNVIGPLLKSIYSLIGSSGTTEADSNTSFANVAYKCKKVIKDNGFAYDKNEDEDGDGKLDGGDWGKVNFSNGENERNPASSNPHSKQIDCSGYVSWVLFKYGSTSGSPMYKTLFNTQKGTKNMKTILQTNYLLFKRIGTLGECELKEGDILLKSETINGVYKGHVEIYSHEDGNTYYCYNAGSTPDIQNGITTQGDCNGEEEKYTVYRVIQ